MTRETINPTRYRALCAGLFLLAGVSAGGAVIIAHTPRATPAEWVLFLVGAVLALALLAMAVPAQRAGKRDVLERVVTAAIAMSALLALQRVAWDFYGPSIDDPSRNLFRVSLAFSPFFYLAAIVVLNARLALRLSWGIWAALLAMVLPALYLHGGLSLARAGTPGVLVWLLLANPLFILMMSALPQYQEQIDEHAAELSRMREREGLMDQLAESERRFNLVVEALDVGVWDRWVGPPERRFWSARFYELLGYTPEELPPSADHLKALLHPDDRDTVWRDGTEQLKRGGTLDVDFRMRTRHRGYRWFNSRAKSVRDATGHMTRMAGSITDIHDRRMAGDALRTAQSELTRLAYRDTLTDQYNRRYFDEHFQREWDRAYRTSEPLALMLIDLDHFKAYNDRYGHPEGDRCLVQVAQLLERAASRPADIVARVGGEEFGIVLPGTPPAGAREVAQRIRARLAEAAIPHAAAPAGRVTVSIGIAAYSDREGPKLADLFEQADKALYEVKRGGRDGVMVFGNPAPDAATPGAGPEH